MNRKGFAPVLVLFVIAGVLTLGTAIFVTFQPTPQTQEKAQVASVASLLETSRNPNQPEATSTSAESNAVATTAPAPTKKEPPAPTAEKTPPVVKSPLTTPVENTPVPQPTRSTNPTTEPLANQRALTDATVAILCVGPAVGPANGPPTYGIAYYVLGSGVTINPNGYVLTNAHVVENTRQCFLGRQYIDASGALHTVVAAVYNLLDIVGTGKFQSIEDIAIPTSEQIAASLHDFAVLKIGERYTSAMMNKNYGSLGTLNIPVASDADYTKYFSNGKFPAIGVNFSYQPMIGDALYTAGYIGDTGRSRFTFLRGKVSAITSNSIGVEMSTGQGLSGSPLVDSKGDLVGLNFVINCGLVGGGGCYMEDEGSVMPQGFIYGHYGLALNVPGLNQAMKEDLGFDLRDLMAKE